MMIEMKERKLSAGSVGMLLVLTLATLLVVFSVAAGLMFGNEVATMMGIERIGDEDLFTMEYKGDYGLDKFLETGASSDTELVRFIVSNVLHGIPLEFDLPDLGCSTFAARLADGTPVFGRNFDMYDSPALLLTTRPENGYASISMVNLAYIGYSADHLPTDLKSSIMALAAPYTPLDGVNEKGLAVGVLLIDTEPTNQQTEKVDITTTSAIRLMLDRAATVEEAVALLKQYDMHASAGSCYHFHIADAQGGSVVVEYIGDKMSVIESDAATNFLLTPGEYDFGAGQDRCETLRGALDANGGVFEDTQQAMALLAAVKQVPREGKRSTTQWSCIYDQDAASVEVAMDMNYGKTYTFSL